MAKVDFQDRPTSLLKITSLYPFRNFLRITQEFYADKVAVKVRSMTVEHDYEFGYGEIGEITDIFSTDGYQRNFGYALAALGTIPLVVCYYLFGLNIILLRIEQALFLIGFAIFLTSFIKSRYINILDRKDKHLTFIKVSGKIDNPVDKMLILIRSRTSDVYEVNIVDPFPEQPPVYELVTFDLASLKKTTNRFYEKELIGMENGVFHDDAYHVRYSEVKGKLYRAKLSNRVWDTCLYWGSILVMIVIALQLGFNVNLGRAAIILISSPLALALFFWLFSFLKFDIVGLHDRNENLVYWTTINHRNRTKVEEIFKFIQSRIPAEDWQSENK